MTTTLTTNAFPIAMPFDTFQVQRLPYTMETLAKLRRDHNRTHSFFRSGDFIYVSPMSEARLPVSTDTVRVSVFKDRDVTSQLIEHVFFKTFIEAYPTRKPLRFYPFTLRSAQDAHDLALRYLPQDLRGKLSFTRQITLHLREIETDQAFFYAFVPEIHHRWHTVLTLDDMKAKGFNIQGILAVHARTVPGYEEVFSPDERLLGEVQSFNDQWAVVQTNAGVEQVALRELRIRMHHQEVAKYLRFALGDRMAEQIMDKIHNDKRLQADPSYVLTEAETLLQRLSTLDFGNKDAFSYRISSSPHSSGRSFSLEPTLLCFDPTPGKVEITPVRGLVSHGPYDSQYFTPKEPHILVICHQSLRGRMADFLGLLDKGVPQSRYFPSGMPTLLRLTKIRFALRDVQGLFPETFEGALDSILREQDRPDYDAAIVVANDAWKNYEPKDNPYLRAKAKLMTAGIPVQCIEENQIPKKADALQYILGPIAVQLYAKCGGTPWLLPARTSVDVEIVIGIGTTVLKNNTWTAPEQSRFVGMTTFFSGNGQFLLSNRMEPVPYAQYCDALVTNLQACLTRLSQEYHWEKGSTVRLVFHAHKPFKNIEADAVAIVANAFPEFLISYAFVQISTEHPFLLMRRHDAASSDVLAERGDNIQMSTKSALLQLKTSKTGKVSAPIQIALHEKSTFRDLHYVCQQTLDFSYLNWRSMQPCHKPVTVFYSELITRLWSRLSETGRWDAVSLNAPRLRKSLWFL